MVWTDSHDGAVLVVGLHVPSRHVIIVDGSNLPKIAETCQNGTGDGAQTSLKPCEKKLEADGDASRHENVENDKHFATVGPSGN